MACRSGFGNCKCYGGTASEWSFEFKIRFPGGGGSDGTELYDLINVIADPSIKMDENYAYQFYSWPTSGFRLTRRFGFPTFIQIISAFRANLPPHYETGHGPYNPVGSRYGISALDANGGHWDPFTPLLEGAPGLLDKYDSNGQEVQNAYRDEDYLPYPFFGTRDLNWGGLFFADSRAWPLEVDDPNRSSEDNARAGRALLIQPGDWFHIRGKIVNG